MIDRDRRRLAIRRLPWLAAAAAVLATLAVGVFAFRGADADNDDVDPLIAFVTAGEGHSDTLDIAVARADGGGFRKVTHHLPVVAWPVWTRDGRSLIVTSMSSSTGAQALWLIESNGRGERRLAEAGEYEALPAPSPDGRLLAELDRAAIVLRAADGHLVRRLPLPGGAEWVVWSPDGRYLAAMRGPRTWLVRTDGREPARRLSRRSETPDAFSPDSRFLLTRTPDSFDVRRRAFITSVDLRTRRVIGGRLGAGWKASWSPDGRLIAYVDESGGIYVVDARNGQARFVAPTRAPQAMNIVLAWGPGGTAIAYSDVSGLYLVDADGRNRIRLTRGCHDMCTFSWRPDGREIAFQSGSRIFAVSPRTGRLRVISQPLKADSPVWAPDRTLIAFTRGSEGLTNDRTLGVFVVRPDGRGLRRIGRGYGPRWAPDSRRLAYVDAADSPDPAGQAQLRNGVIVVADLHGGSKRIATGTSPTWSPDGKTIAFARYTFTRPPDPSATSEKTVVAESTLLLVNADGTNERMLRRGKPYFPFQFPRWAPDGSAIAVWQGIENEYSDPWPYWRLGIIDPQSGHERVLPVETSATFRWSPDSRTILYDNGAGLGTVDVVSGKITRALDLPSEENVAFLAWSPDGREIAYVHESRDGSTELWTARADGSHRQQVTHSPGIEGEIAWAP